MIEILCEKTISTLYVSSYFEIAAEVKTELQKFCKRLLIIPRIKAQISYAFEKLKNEENVEKRAIIFFDNNDSVNVIIFEYYRETYYCIVQRYDLKLTDIASLLEEQSVLYVYYFCPQGDYSVLDVNGNITLNKFEIRDYENLALNGCINIDEKLRILKDRGEFTLKPRQEPNDFTLERFSSIPNGYEKSSGKAYIKFIFYEDSCCFKVYDENHYEIKTSHGE